MKQLTGVPRVRMAYHEAGHAIAALALSLPFERCVIGDTAGPRRSTGGTCYLRHEPLPPERLPLCAPYYMAGLAAEALAGWELSTAYLEGNTDIPDLDSLNRQLRAPISESVALVQACNLLRKHWLAAEALADRLIERGHAGEPHARHAMNYGAFLQRNGRSLDRACGLCGAYNCWLSQRRDGRMVHPCARARHVHGLPAGDPRYAMHLWS